VIKARPGLVMIMPHVPFPNERRLIACLLKHLGKESSALGHWALIVHHAMMMHILTGQDRGPAWAAEGGGHKSMAQVHAPGCHPIQVGGLEKVRTLIHETHEIIAVIVTQDEDDVTGCCLKEAG
jgi:hypothetical protein